LAPARWHTITEPLTGSMVQLGDGPCRDSRHSRVASRTPEPEDLRAVTCATDRPSSPPLVIGVRQLTRSAASGNLVALCDDHGAPSWPPAGRSWSPPAGWRRGPAGLSSRGKPILTAPYQGRHMQSGRGIFPEQGPLTDVTPGTTRPDDRQTAEAIPRISHDQRQAAASDGIRLPRLQTAQGRQSVPELYFPVVAGDGFEPT